MAVRQTPALHVAPMLGFPPGFPTCRPTDLVSTADLDDALIKRIAGWIAHEGHDTQQGADRGSGRWEHL